MSMQQSEGGERRPWHQRRNAARAARRRQEREEIAEAARLGVSIIPKLRLDTHWTDEEDQIIISAGDDTKQLLRRLPGRSESAIKRRRRTLRLVSYNLKVWTTNEDKIIRGNIARCSSIKQIAALLPGRDDATVGRHIRLMGLKFQPPAADTGSNVINALKDRCKRLGYSMKDLDKIALTGKYFQNRSWARPTSDGSGKIATKMSGMITKAVDALGGTLRVDWPDEGESIDTIDVGEG